jgi:hypothetical protein
MKTYGGVGIPDLGTSRRRLISFTPQLIYTKYSQYSVEQRQMSCDCRGIELLLSQLFKRKGTITVTYLVAVEITAPPCRYCMFVS